MPESVNDVDDLVAVIRVMDRAAALLSEEEEHLRAHSVRTGDVTVAGSPEQTLVGISELHSAARESVHRLAQAIGYVTAGLEKQAWHAMAKAKTQPLTLPSGTNRMARPLGARTVQALELVRDAGEFFEGDIATDIEVCLAAPQATYPPEDWEEYRLSRSRGVEP